MKIVEITEFSLINETLVIETEQSKMRLKFSEAKDLAERIIQLLNKIEEEKTN